MKRNAAEKFFMKPSILAGEKGEKYDSQSVRLNLVSHHEHGGGMGCTTSG
jgi:hypothetical protein